MRSLTPVVLLALIMMLSATAPNRASQAVPVDDRPCGASGTAYTRTTLYFGLTRPNGKISEGQWQAFLRDKVTPRFPNGLTVWEADGQWRRPDGHISRERAKVLLLVHTEAAPVRTALAEIIAEYKRSFQQESVLWETAPVCAAF